MRKHKFTIVIVVANGCHQMFHILTLLNFCRSDFPMDLDRFDSSNK